MKRTNHILIGLLCEIVFASASILMGILAAALVWSV